MTEKQLEDLELGDKVTSPGFEHEAQVKTIDKEYGSVTLEVDNGGVAATIPVGFDGMLSHWELA